MAKVYDLKTGQRKKVSRLEFLGLVNTAEKYINELRPFRVTNNGLDEAIKILSEIKFDGLYNPQFRDECVNTLEELLDEMYIEINGK